MLKFIKYSNTNAFFFFKFNTLKMGNVLVNEIIFLKYSNADFFYLF